MTDTLRAALLAWYDRNARDLPWRRTRDPYAIWVSEVMLQQTRVDTVLPYYQRFLDDFPTLEALATADEDRVLGAWSGLGYYRRARLLHRGAREVVARHGGRVPEDPAARRSIPGIGRYTAGAIGSIAFDKAEPLVDGNVARVLARVHAVATPLGRADTERALWRHAEDLVPGERPGALNQALMELGAVVCTRARPRCGECPIAAECAARRAGLEGELPVARTRRAPVEVRWTAVVARDPAGKLWLERQDGALFGGTWSAPMREGGDRAGREGAQDHARTVLAAAGLEARGALVPVGRVAHTLTHRHIVADVFRASGVHGRESERLRRADARALDGVGVSRLAARILSLADAVPPSAEPGGQLRLPHEP